jgi:hypothetical protein
MLMTRTDVETVLYRRNLCWRREMLAVKAVREHANESTIMVSAKLQLHVVDLTVCPRQRVYVRINDSFRD